MSFAKKKRKSQIGEPPEDYATVTVNDRKAQGSPGSPKGRRPNLPLQTDTNEQDDSQTRKTTMEWARERYRKLTKGSTSSSNTDSSNKFEGISMNELVDLEIGVGRNRDSTERSQTSSRASMESDSQSTVRTQSFQSEDSTAPVIKRTSKKRILDKQEMEELIKRKKKKQLQQQFKQELHQKQGAELLRKSNNRRADRTNSRVSNHSTVTAETLPSRHSNKRGGNERFSYNRLDLEKSRSMASTEFTEGTSEYSRSGADSIGSFARSPFSSTSTGDWRTMNGSVASARAGKARSQRSNKRPEIGKIRKTHSKNTQSSVNRLVPPNMRHFSMTSSSSRGRSDTVSTALSSILDPLSYTMKTTTADQIDDALAPFKQMISRVKSIGKTVDYPKSEDAFRHEYDIEEEISLAEAFNSITKFPPPRYDSLAIYPESSRTIFALDHARKINFEVRYTKVWVVAKRVLEKQIKLQADDLRKEAPSHFKVLSLNRAIVAMEYLHRIGAQVKLTMIRPFKQFVIDMSHHKSHDQMERSAKKIVKILSIRLRGIMVTENKLRRLPMGILLLEGKWKCEICNKKKGPKSRFQRRLHCDHVFHKDCIDEWLEDDHIVCPECNTYVDKKRPKDFTNCYRFFCEWFYYVAVIFPLGGLLFGFLVALVGITIEALFSLDQINISGFFKNIMLSYVLSFIAFGAASQGISCIKYFGTPEYDSDVWLIFPGLLALTWAPFFAYALSDSFESAETPEDTLRATWRAFGVFLLFYVGMIFSNHYCGLYCSAYGNFWSYVCVCNPFRARRRYDSEDEFDDDMSDFTESSFDSMETGSFLPTMSESGARAISPSTTKIVEANGESSFL